MTSIPYEQLVERDLRRNMTAIVGWEFLWGLGLPFALYWTMVPAYLQQLQASKTLIGIVGSFPTWNTILCNMGAEICPEVKPGRLMALGHSSVLLGVVPAMAACGRLADCFGSYDGVFSVLLTLALVSALGFALLVREPRTGRLYMIKPLRRA